MPDQPDTELLAALRSALAEADPGRQSIALFDVAAAVDATLLLAWEKAEGPPIERFAVALQAAVEALEGIGLALAEGDKAEG